MSDECNCDDGSAGCAFLIGFVIVAIAVGNLWEPAAGWLILGIGLMIAAALD